MKLPEKNKEVYLQEIKEICVAYGMMNLTACGGSLFGRD